MGGGKWGGKTWGRRWGGHGRRWNKGYYNNYYRLYYGYNYYGGCSSCAKYWNGNAWVVPSCCSTVQPYYFHQLNINRVIISNMRTIIISKEYTHTLIFV